MIWYRGRDGRTLPEKGHTPSKSVSIGELVSSASVFSVFGLILIIPNLLTICKRKKRCSTGSGSGILYGLQGFVDPCPAFVEPDPQCCCGGDGDGGDREEIQHGVDRPREEEIHDHGSRAIDPAAKEAEEHG